MVASSIQQLDQLTRKPSLSLFNLYNYQQSVATNKAGRSNHVAGPVHFRVNTLE